MKRHYVLMLANYDEESAGEREAVKSIECDKRPSEKGIERMMQKFKCKYAWVREEYFIQ